MTEDLLLSNKINTSEKLRATEDTKPIHNYQISELHREINYLNNRLSIIPKPIQIICEKILQFWWTITRAIGLGWLHDGTKKNIIESGEQATIAPSMVPAEKMPIPRVFLDVTQTHKSKHNTGVQRVIRQLCQHGGRDGSLSPVIISDGQFVTLPNYEPLAFQNGDRILLLDTGWINTSIYPLPLNSAKSQGAEIILGIHDLIPVQYPGFVHPYFTLLFSEWLKTITPICSTVLAVSKQSAELFIEWNNHNTIKNHITSIGWFHLGANFNVNPNNISSEQSSDIVLPERYFLTVGTIEPRKGYSVALDVFDRLWLEGSTLNYIIIGRPGVLASNIIDRVINHPQFRKKLHWPKNVNDYKLNEYYQKSTGVILPTLAEGFGLPLVEAATYRKPIIASDLPVFREIAPNGVMFFQPGNSDDLYEKLNNYKLSPIPQVDNILSWENATTTMLNIIKTNKYQINLNVFK